MFYDSTSGWFFQPFILSNRACFFLFFFGLHVNVTRLFQKFFFNKKKTTPSVGYITPRVNSEGKKNVPRVVPTINQHTHAQSIIYTHELQGDTIHTCRCGIFFPKMTCLTLTGVNELDIFINQTNKTNNRNFFLLEKNFKEKKIYLEIFNDFFSLIRLVR